VSWRSSIGTVMGYRQDGEEIGRDLKTIQSHGYWGFPLRIGYDSDHLSPFSAEIRTAQGDKPPLPRLSWQSTQFIKHRHNFMFHLYFRKDINYELHYEFSA
jgi:hypothetical protein